MDSTDYFFFVEFMLYLGEEDIWFHGGGFRGCSGRRSIVFTAQCGYGYGQGNGRNQYYRYCDNKFFCGHEVSFPNDGWVCVSCY